MQLIKHRESWNPLREIEDLSERMNRLFGHAKWLGNGEKETLALADWAPACDISETDSSIVFMPDDADASKVDAKFKNGVLNITIQKSKAKPSAAKEIAIQ